MIQLIGLSYELMQTLPGILWQRVVLPVTTASGRQGRLRATLELYLQGTLDVLCFSLPSLSSVFFSPLSEFIATAP